MTVVVQEADLFLIPPLNGQPCVGQVIDVTETEIFCTLSKRQVTDGANITALSLSELPALMLIGPKAMTSAVWPIVGFDTTPHVNGVFKWKKAKANGYSNLQTHDPAVIEAFANAVFGHDPWDGFGAPDFFSRVSITPTQIPETAAMTSGTPASFHADAKYQ